MFHWVCEEGAQWQASTGSFLLLPRLDQSLAWGWNAGPSRRNKRSIVFFGPLPGGGGCVFN